MIRMKEEDIDINSYNLALEDVLYELQSHVYDSLPDCMGYTDRIIEFNTVKDILSSMKKWN